MLKHFISSFKSSEGSEEGALLAGGQTSAQSAMMLAELQLDVADKLKSKSKTGFRLQPDAMTVCQTHLQVSFSLFVCTASTLDQLQGDSFFLLQLIDPNKKAIGNSNHHDTSVNNTTSLPI